MKRFLILLIFIGTLFCSYSQNNDPSAIYEDFKKSAQQNYNSFRDECNRKYAEYLRTAWEWYQGEAPLPIPDEMNPRPPRPYDKENHIGEDKQINPVIVNPIPSIEQPKPVKPIYETPAKDVDTVEVAFYGIKSKIRIPGYAKVKLDNISPDVLADAWEMFSAPETNNTIRDCLEARIRYNLNDWAYLQFVNALASQYCKDKNSAALLAAFLFCQSGYQIRLAQDGKNLIMLFGTRHKIYNYPYFMIDGGQFYPYQSSSGQIQVCNIAFNGETPLSLEISETPLLGDKLSEGKEIKSRRFSEINVESKVPLALIDFFNSYPSSSVDNNPLTRWALYANTPLAKECKGIIYPVLSGNLEDCSELEAVNKLLNLVQTGFTYEVDEKVWGHDRAFFAEETLYYPYSDCEDRAILFSRLTRDLLGLDVALIYYPGHLASAVKFNNEVKGDAVMINGERYVICDPTYIGAPVGKQMPGLEYDKVEAIKLKR